VTEDLPTVTGLLAPLVEVDDRGVYFEDSFTSWRDHIRQGAAIAAALKARLDPERPPHVGVLLQNTPFFSAVLAWLVNHGTLGRSAYQLGVLERALELTSTYAREREQFDRPIGSFQAVSSRLADGYIDVKALRLTLTQAAWRLSEDLPADVEVSTAAFWAADAGHRLAHTTVHVHGGVGIDTDHPVHRYFLAAKQTEFAVGSATGQLLRIGRELADTPA